MALSKVEYVDEVTVIPAQNLNDIQDEIIDLNSTIESIEPRIDSGLLWRGICTSASNNADKIVGCSDFELVDTTIIAVRFTMGNTVSSNMTLNVNNTGAIPVRYDVGNIGSNYRSTVPLYSTQTVIFRYIASVPAWCVEYISPYVFPTPNAVIVNDSYGRPMPSNTINTTELGYLNGVTSNIQTQINDAKSGLSQFVANLLTASENIEELDFGEFDDESKIYVWRGETDTYINGHVYYHNGTQWVDAGVYSREGAGTEMPGMYSHAEGDGTTASGESSHAEGMGSEASGDFSHASGENTLATRRSQTVIGRENIPDTDGEDEEDYGKYAFIIGNGRGTRSNALTVDWKGNLECNETIATANEAKQLLSDSYVEESEPYLFRRSKSIGDRASDMIVGGSLVVNQLMKNGNFADTSGWFTSSGTYAVSNNVLTLTATSGYTQIYQTLSYISGHKYLLCVDAQSNTEKTLRIQSSNSSYGIQKFFSLNASFRRCAFVDNAEATGSTATLFLVANSVSEDTFSFKNANCIDLTLMFGSTIADYIYSLEQANAGDGVAWFKKYFPNDYYEYNAGEFQHVKPTARKTVGFNQWDEIGEDGKYWNDNGQLQNYMYNSCTDKIRVIGGQNYYFSNLAYSLTAKYFDRNMALLLKFTCESGEEGRIYKAPQNAYYLCVNFSNGTIPTNFCVNLSNPDKNGTYEPYEEHVYPLNSPRLLGIPELDENNNLVYDGDTFNYGGMNVDRYNIVDLGTLNWGYNSTYNVFLCTINGIEIGLSKLESAMRCSKYITVENPGLGAIVDKFIGTNSSGGLSTDRIWVQDTSYSDVTTFKAAMSGVYLVYKKATPTTSLLEALNYKNPQVVDKYGTEEYITTGIIPIGHKTKYYTDLKDKLESSPNTPTTDGDYILRRENGENKYVSADVILGNIGNALDAISGEVI